MIERTTVRLPKDLLDHARRKAAAEGRTLTSLIEDGQSSEDLLRGITTVSYLAWRDDRQLREYVLACQEYGEQLKALDAEVRLQEEQTRQMGKRKNEAVKALDAAGNGGVVNGVPVPTPSATQAPRGPNGTWPPESATVDDPTTSGRITPRTFHALSEARRFGFTHFTGCFRPGAPRVPRSHLASVLADCGTLPRHRPGRAGTGPLARRRLRGAAVSPPASARRFQW